MMIGRQPASGLAPTFLYIAMISCCWRALSSGNRSDFLHLRLEQFHLAHRRVGFVGEREERQFYKQRQQQDREPKIAEQPIEELQGQKDRFRQEIEPAKIDREIEMRNARFGISIEKVDLLGARKKAG